jgi:hypothetical protein
MADPHPVSGGNLGGLALPRFCGRCFWLGLHRDLPFQMGLPGVFSSIDAFTKNAVHAHFDREGRLPPWFPDVGAVEGYESALSSKRFRSADPETGVILSGVPDDLFRMKDGSLHIVDYKTSRFTATQDALYPKYEVQLNSYAWIAERLGLGPVSGLSLVYLEPRTDGEAAPPVPAGPAMGFAPRRVEVPVRPDRVLPPLLRRFRDLHASASPPPGIGGCEDCAALEDVLGVLAK